MDRLMSAAAWPAALLVGLLAGAPPGAAQVSLTQDEALALAFPAADSIARQTAYLEQGQVERAHTAAGEGTRPPPSVVTFYVAYEGTGPVGVAYFDAHIVRTHPETLMVVVGTDDRIERIEILSFYEPPEYQAPDGWIEQLEGEALAPSLSVRGDIVNISGATLTSSAVTEAARRVLALHEIIQPFEP